ncbi:glycosyltransferase involved in cell wall biosynthesis [Salinibacter ruber]|uniref:glycosyltransferase family 2 protein n=1 Tax=Salinibacter ruber TaxID=146919 RepID=UPI0021675674|nr:glycosyltransferase [Salinibacter ruber]MCS4034710.1 glycosyltransferase involved in cell wall biosynthesis [Salinibacter ruber]
MDKNKVSIIIPCYNEQEYIGKAIESALGQTYDPIEVIVIDDGSIDDSPEVIKSYDDKIIFRMTENGGAAHARNRGVTVSSGEYLKFLDADDWISSGAVEALVSALEDSRKSVSMCPWSKLVPQGDGSWETDPGLPLAPREGQDWIQSWLTGRYIPPCSVLWRRETFEDLGGWDETHTSNDDGELMLRFLTKGGDIVTTDKGNAYYRQYQEQGESLSTRFSPETVRTRGMVIDKTRERLRSRGDVEEYRREIGEAYQGVARMAFHIGAWKLGRTYEAKARHIIGRLVKNGSVAHKILGTTFGLEGKERIARWLDALTGVRSSN